LVIEFASKLSLVKITGLAPEKGITAQTQRDNFANKIQQQLGIAKPAADDWENLFIYLAQNTSKKNIVILLDEISWMAEGDPSFLPTLKNARDDHFQKNNTKNQQGCQIDYLIQTKYNGLFVCEIKFSKKTHLITSNY